MELSQLRTLVHVAELGDLSKAADRLRIAQPALSRQIRLLEEELGVRALRPARAGDGDDGRRGRTCCGHAMRVMAELEEIRATVADGGCATAGPCLHRDAANRRRHPLRTPRRRLPRNGIRKRRSGSSAPIRATCWTGCTGARFDAAILYDPKSARTLRVQPLAGGGAVPHRPGGRGAFSGHAGRLRRPRGCCACSSRRGPRPPRNPRPLRGGTGASRSACRVEADSYATLKDLVRGGHGCTILPRAPIHRGPCGGRADAAPLRNPVPLQAAGALLPDRPPRCSARPLRRAGHRGEGQREGRGRRLARAAAGPCASGDKIPL